MRENPSLSGRIPPKSGWLDSLGVAEAQAATVDSAAQYDDWQLEEEEWEAIAASAAMNGDNDNQLDGRN